MPAFDAPHIGDVIAASRCVRDGGSCGVWYDARAHAALHARLADPRVRAALFAAPRVPPEVRRPHPACPRCEREGTPRRLAQVAFVGLTLDLCEGCLGLWIDHDEVSALLNALELYEPGEPAQRVTHYRAMASGTTMQPNGVVRTRCVRCRQLVPFARSLATEHGLMCARCADTYQHDGAAPSDRDLEALNLGRRTLWSHVRSVLASLGIG